jgi:FAD:protein FMN transferase
VPVSPEMARFVQAALYAAQLTGGLVDATLLAQIRDAGYDRHENSGRLPLELALRLNRRRVPARARPSTQWRSVSVAEAIVMRPPGIQLDSGGIAKGLFADLLGSRLARYRSYAVDCAGDLRLAAQGACAGRSASRAHSTASYWTSSSCGRGRRDRRHRAAELAGCTGSSGPPPARPGHRATGLYGRRPGNRLRAHGSGGRGAGAKSAVLAGPERAPRCLRRGRLVVLDDGSHFFSRDAAGSSPPLMRRCARS